MATKLLFVSPQLQINSKDTLTTGIVFMPFVLAEAVGLATHFDCEIQVIDCFAENTTRAINRPNSSDIIIGIDNQQFVNLLDQQPSCNDTIAIVFANQIANHWSIKQLCSVAVGHPNIKKVFVLENSEAVTAYSLAKVEDEFVKIGVDGFFKYDVETEFLKFLKSEFLQTRQYLPRFQHKGNVLAPLEQPDTYFPGWDYFPLKSYWSLNFGHGPVSNKKYLPLLTSKGCPYPCNFCVMPALSNRSWRYRTAESIFHEISHWYRMYQVTEFHIEDTNPTINCERLVQLGALIEASELNKRITWKIVSGTKLETVKTKQELEAMQRGGLNYISFSPESGSKKIRDGIGKRFNIEHSFKFLQWSREFGVKTQACFVIGFPNENISDLVASTYLIHKLTRKGLDEVAIFMITPIPGSQLFENKQLVGYADLDRFTFTPDWRKDFRALFLARLMMYLVFLGTKAIFFPLRFIRNTRNIFATKRRSIELKMETAPIRSSYFKKLLRK